MIEIHALSKTYGARIALQNVDLSIDAGESVALVGPNGAGKTTLLRVLATLTRPTSGSASIDGIDVARSGHQVRQRVGFLSHRTLLYDDLSAEQNLTFYGRMYALGDGPARIDTVLTQVGLELRRHDLVRTFSHGMQQRLAVARAILHRPALLLLDEPYAGLDAGAAQDLTALLTRLAKDGCTVLMSTHNRERGQAITRRVVALRRGKVVHDAPWAGVESGALLAPDHKAMP